MQSAHVDEAGVPTPCETMVDFRDDQTMWIWVGDNEEYRLELTREDVMGFVRSFLYQDAYYQTQEYVEKATLEIKMALWEGVYDAADNS